MNIIFIIDISGSMKGLKIEALKDSIDNIVLSLKETNNQNCKIAVETFSRDVNWLYPNFIPIEEFMGINPICSGMTSMGAAFRSLFEFLKQNQESTDNKIILFTDGAPTDDYEEGIDLLYDLESFKISERFAVQIGEDVDLNVLNQFTESSDNIFQIQNIDVLIEKLINSCGIDNITNTNPILDTDSSDQNNWT